MISVGPHGAVCKFGMSCLVVFTTDTKICA